MIFTTKREVQTTAAAHRPKMASAAEKQLHDKVLLETLDLIEQYVACKVDIEKTMNAGQLHMAKSRYIQGGQSVAQSKLPTENSADFNALKTVRRKNAGQPPSPPPSPHTDDDDTLELHTHPVDRDNDFVDPLRWFGVLVPRSLHLAQENFNRAIQLSVECANIQVKLQQATKYLFLLRNKADA